MKDVIRPIIREVIKVSTGYHLQIYTRDLLSFSSRPGNDIQLGYIRHVSLTRSASHNAIEFEDVENM